MDKMIYLQTIKSIRDSLPPEKRDGFDLNFQVHEKSQTMAFVLSVFFGTLGVDRFYVGDILLGILKLITLGGFFVWHLVDLFLIMGAARKRNVEIAQEAKLLVT